MDKKFLHWVIWAYNFKKLFLYFKSTSSNLFNCRVLLKNKKCLNLKPKMLDLGIFDKNSLILVILGKKFRKPIVIFEIRILNFVVYLQSFAKKKTKMPKLGTKNAWFRYFSTEIGTHYCHVWNHHHQIFQTAKLVWKTKMPQFRTKNAFFGYFSPKMPYLGIFGLEFQKCECHI